VLDRHDPPGAETPAVPAAVDIVDDRRIVVARAEKIGMQRVRLKFVHGLAGRQQGLRQNLSAEHPLGADVTARAAEQVVLKRFELHQPQQFIESFGLSRHDFSTFAAKLRVHN
jgi:hypothetical protein